ncbi:hypothetical protein D3C73_1148970 [compost metagenome]
MKLLKWSVKKWICWPLNLPPLKFVNPSAAIWYTPAFLLSASFARFCAVNCKNTFRFLLKVVTLLLLPFLSITVIVNPNILLTGCND